MAEEPTAGQIAVLLARAASPEVKVDRRRVFKFLLPLAICVSAVLGSITIERTYPEGDGRNCAGPCIAFVMLIPGVILAGFAVREALRPDGLNALIWNALLAVGPWLIFLLLIKFGLARHF